MLPPYEKVAVANSSLDIRDQLDHHRHRAVAIRKRHTAFGLVIAAAGVGLMWTAIGTTSMADALRNPELEGYFYRFLFGILVILCAVLYIRAAYRRTEKKFSRISKRLIVPPLVDSMVSGAEYPSDGTNGRLGCSYNADGFIPASELLKFPIFGRLSKAEKYTGENHFIGTLGAADFQMSEISAYRVERQYDSDYKRKEQFFEGLVLIADLPHDFGGTTVIETRKGKTSGSLPRAGEALDGITYDFDREFRVWTTDETTARDLLQGDMLEKLARLRGQFPKNAMSICLHEGKLAIAIHRVDLLEARGMKLDEDSIRNTYDEIRSILDIVDLLHLNTRTWHRPAT